MRARVSDIEAFCRRLLVSVGADSDESAAVGEILAWCDLVGRPNQGVWRLETLAERLVGGGIRSAANYRVEQQTPAVATLHGNAGFGHFLVREAADRAAQMAAEQGIAVVSVVDSNFCGALAYYAARLADRGCLSLIFSNSYPKATAHGGTRRVLGTNPMAFGAPGTDGRHVIVDMSTASSAGSTVTKALESGTRLPPGVAVYADGSPLTDPADLPAGALLPAAGAKGFGLSLMVEILAAVYGGARSSFDLGSLYGDPPAPGGNGQAIVAIDAYRHVGNDRFASALTGLEERIRQSGDGNGSDDSPLPRMPGSARWAQMARNSRDGIELDEGTMQKISRLSARFGVHWAA